MSYVYLTLVFIFSDGTTETDVHVYPTMESCISVEQSINSIKPTVITSCTKD